MMMTYIKKKNCGNEITKMKSNLDMVSFFVKEFQIVSRKTPLLVNSFINKKDDHKIFD